MSSLGSDFNFDFGVAYTDAELADGPKHNMHVNWDHTDTPNEPVGGAAEMPPMDLHGMSAFALEYDVVYHTYSAYGRIPPRHAMIYAERMTKVDALKALREARAGSVAPAPADADGAGASPSLCGHRGMGNKSCQRAAGHAEKSHRYK